MHPAIHSSWSDVSTTLLASERTMEKRRPLDIKNVVVALKPDAVIDFEVSSRRQLRALVSSRTPRRKRTGVGKVRPSV